MKLESIPGNHHVRRFLEVAAALPTSRPVVLIGPEWSDARTFVSTELGQCRTYCPRVFAPCPCGNYGDPSAECTCEPAEVTAHRRQWRCAAMVVEVVRPDARECLATPAGEPEADALARAKQARADAKAVPLELDRECGALLAEAYTSLNLWPRDVRQILDVARAVAALDGHARIEAAAILEAIQYKAGALK